MTTRNPSSSFLRRSRVANVAEDGMVSSAHKIHARLKHCRQSAWVVCTRGGDVYVTGAYAPSSQVQLVVAREPRALMGEEYTRADPLELIERDLRTQADSYCGLREKRAA